MSALSCNCMECRVRHAIHGGSPDAPFEAEVGEAIGALGNVMAELLAHVPTKTAKYCAVRLLECRKEWQKHLRVAAQHTQGSA
jgi:hypothetical protein